MNLDASICIDFFIYLNEFLFRNLDFKKAVNKLKISLKTRFSFAFYGLTSFVYTFISSKHVCYFSTNSYFKYN